MLRPFFILWTSNILEPIVLSSCTWYSLQYKFGLLDDYILDVNFQCLRTILTRWFTSLFRYTLIDHAPFPPLRCAFNVSWLTISPHRPYMANPSGQLWLTLVDVNLLLSWRFCHLCLIRAIPSQWSPLRHSVYIDQAWSASEIGSFQSIV